MTIDSRDPHNPRPPFCPCDRCEALRVIDRSDVFRDNNPLLYQFNARTLGKLLELAIRYQKGDLD